MMRFKKWCIAAVTAAVAVLLVYAGFNILIDPFGVFGDVIFSWGSYSMTQNPRVAKLEYLEEHPGEYDAFILGSSSASSYSAAELSEYTGYSWYNMFSYGCDMYDILKQGEYLLENYEVKSLLVNLGPGEAQSFDFEPDKYTNSLSYKADGSSKAAFYLKYAFAPPGYAVDKLAAYGNDTYLPQPFDVFLEESGVYDKSVRDIEPIGAMPAFLANNPDGGFGSMERGEVELNSTDKCVEALSELKRRCEERGVELVCFFEPVYSERLSSYNTAELTDYLTKLAGVTDYWSFSFNSVCEESRYYYDSAHFRNCVGTMAMSRVYGGEAYVPEDFGVLVSGESAAEFIDYVNRYCSEKKYTEPDDEDRAEEVTILLYHALGDKGISAEAFESHMAALSEAGYNTVSFDDLIAYVKYGEPLPEKPLVITFDDGYTSVYELAYPILQKYNMRSTIFTIGVSVGKDTYKDTDEPIIPHFSFDEAQEMINSGLVSIQTHTYDMHQVERLDGDDCRKGVLSLPGESESDYLKALRDDLTKAISDIEQNTTEKVNVVSYPYGFFSKESAVICSELGIEVTLGTEEAKAVVIKGLPQSLYGMTRYNVEHLTADELIELLAQK